MAILSGAIVKIVARHTTLRVNTDRGVCLHIAVSNAASLYNYFNQPGNPTSHFYVRSTGNTNGMADFEQYVDTKYRAPANLEGNPSLISIETQGGVGDDLNNPWPATMVKRLAWIIAECHRIHNIPIQAMPNSRPESNGVGYHRQGVDPYRVAGGELWSTSYGKVCPGQVRINQIPSIITLARTLSEDHMSAADVEALKDYIDAKFQATFSSAGTEGQRYSALQNSINAANTTLGTHTTKLNSIITAVAAVNTAVAALHIAVEGVASDVWGTQIADVSTPESGDTSAASTLLTHAAPRAGDAALTEIQPHLDEIKVAINELEAAVAALTPVPPEPPAPLA
ncbi:N-acetylmuramoyl-L-alanine amidase [Kribbella orskensis]|uniref:N-acetylmuramoyl-L-alanine amidase n=1 Tax=Kribbella orskensis TaxID=2512216 RepID=A0ABY2BVP1_9ACTN|nr:N-acetylmuramoyl-L-alanine amidase [Kribbella orskensis]TCO32302.1 N-acetylmuramoyl-L-alanine amidase [Kribbella orskensis]